MSWIFPGLVVKSLLVIFMDYLFRDKSLLNLPTNWHATNSVGTNYLHLLHRKEKGEEKKYIIYSLLPIQPSRAKGQKPDLKVDSIP